MGSLFPVAGGRWARAPAAGVLAAGGTSRGNNGDAGWALWPYCERRVFNINDFALLTRRGLIRYSEYLARCIREDLARDPLAPDETLAFVVYSGGAPVVQAAANLLLPEIRTGAYVFFGPALRPRMAPRNWAEGTRSVSCLARTTGYKAYIHAFPARGITRQARERSRVCGRTFRLTRATTRCRAITGRVISRGDLARARACDHRSARAGIHHRASRSGCMTNRTAILVTFLMPHAALSQS